MPADPPQRRSALTVRLDCVLCGGTGRVVVRVPMPGMSRAGGGPGGVRAIETERLCTCVRVDAPGRREEE